MANGARKMALDPKTSAQKAPLELAWYWEYQMDVVDFHISH
ncbi:MAG: hypothetical protein OET07_17820 [Desulfobacteraceae bacterium]|nr:hypothetical protein [Desulfobacteraceae bacterium]